MAVNNTKSEIQQPPKLDHFKTPQQSSSGEDEDGWAYWSQIYDSPKLRAEIAIATAEEPTLAEVLGAVRLRRTQLVVENLPYNFDERRIKSMIELRTAAASVITIRFNKKRRRAWISFYRAEDANRAMHALNEHAICGCKLRAYINQVVLNSPADDQLQANNIDNESMKIGNPYEMEVENESKNARPDESIAVATPNIQNRRSIPTSRVPIEFVAARHMPNQDIVKFAKCVYSLLCEDCGVLSLNDRRIHTAVVQSAPAVQLFYQLWPLGLMRHLTICYPNYLALLDQHVCLATLRIAPDSSASALDSWEPLSPLSITTLSQLVQYVVAMAQRFGVELPGGVTKLSLHHISVEYTAAALKMSSLHEFVSRLCACHCAFSTEDDQLYVINHVATVE